MGFWLTTLSFVVGTVVGATVTNLVVIPVWQRIDRQLVRWYARRNLTRDVAELMKLHEENLELLAKHRTESLPDEPWNEQAMANHEEHHRQHIAAAEYALDLHLTALYDRADVARPED